MATLNLKSVLEAFVFDLRLALPSGYKNEFENEVFKFQMYTYDEFDDDCSEDFDQWNFTWKNGNFRISWQAFIGNKMLYSRLLTYTEFEKMQLDCLVRLLIAI